MKINKLRLETERLILRPFSLRDASDLIEIEKFNKKFRGKDALQKAQTWIKKSVNKKGFYLAIVLKEENKVIGYTELCHLDWFPYHEAGEICYHLNKRYWGKGYATEGSKSLIDYCFGKLKFRKIYADTDPDNFASQNVLKKLGFKLEGVIREKHFVKGKWIDEHDFGLLRKEWKR